MSAKYDFSGCVAFLGDVKHPHDRLVVILLAHFGRDYALQDRSLELDSLLSTLQIRRSFNRLNDAGLVVGDECGFSLDGFAAALPEEIKAPTKKPLALWGKTRLRIFKRDGGECVYCNKDVSLEQWAVDHIHPRSRGGSDVDTNLALACIKCNSSKGDRTPEEWRAAS